MAVIPPRSSEFIDFIYVDEADGKYSQLIKNSSVSPQIVKTNSSSREILIQDMQPFDYAKQFNKIVEVCHSNVESKQNPDVFKFQPKTIHPDKLKIPKYFLTMKSRANGRVQRLYTTPYNSNKAASSEQKNLESTNDEENTTHEDSKNTSLPNKVSIQQIRKMRQASSEEEFISNYKKQFNDTQTRLLFDKKNQLRFSSIGKQRQDCMKIYDELKREQQQIWFDKITQNSLQKEAVQNKIGIRQYFSSSTENLANLENSINAPSPMLNNHFENSPDFKWNTGASQTTTSMSNMPPLGNTKSISNINNPSNSKSMTNLQRIMAQLTTPKRDFFFTNNIHLSSKKDLFVNRILQNVSSLKSLDEDSIIKSVSKQIKNNLSSKKIKFPHYRSKSVIVHRIQPNQKLEYKTLTPMYKKGDEIVSFSQSCTNLSKPNIEQFTPQQQKNQYFYSSSTSKKPQIIQQKQKGNNNSATFEDINGEEEYTYSYSRNKKSNINSSNPQQQTKNNFKNTDHNDGYQYSSNKPSNIVSESQYNTPIKRDMIKENLEEADNHIINNMKYIIKKYQTPSHKEDTHQVSSTKIVKTVPPTNSSSSEAISNQPDQRGSIDQQQPKKFDKHKAFFEYLTKQKMPHQETSYDESHYSPLIKQVPKHSITISQSKNQALMNSKIIEKLNYIQKDVSDNTAFFSDPRAIRQKQ